MNELALFAGAGGGILGGKLLGWRTVCAVEIDPYAAGVLAARQNDGCLPPFPIWDDIRTFEGGPWRGVVDVVSGGFPCQDISAAGKGAGIEGARSRLWWEMCRIIGEVGPRYVLVENSPMLVSRGLGRVLGDLAALGYDASWGVLGAHHAGAPHKRDRIWILGWLANAMCDGAGEGSGSLCGEAGPKAQREGRRVQPQLGDGGEDVPDADGGGSYAEQERLPRGASSADFDRDGSLRDVADAGGSRQQRSELPGALRNERDRPEAHGSTGERGSLSGSEVGDAAGAGFQDGFTGEVGESGAEPESERSGGWPVEPDVGRVADGVAARVDRLRGIGNGQVPDVVPMAWDFLRPE